MPAPHAAAPAFDPATGPSTSRLVRGFVLWMLLGWIPVFALVFGALCAIECTALPWYSLLIAPAICLVVAIVLGVRTWRRARDVPREQRRTVLAILLTSIIWGPLLGHAAASVVGMVAMAAGMLFWR